MTFISSERLTPPGKGTQHLSPSGPSPAFGPCRRECGPRGGMYMIVCGTGRFRGARGNARENAVRPVLTVRIEGWYTSVLVTTRCALVL
jgi:hypothetical protein